MKLHQGDRKSFPCHICSKLFTEKSSVKIHIMSVHNRDANKEICPICKGEYTKFTIKVHMKVHSDRPKLTCETCQKEFITKETLKTHMARHEGRQKKLCTLCNKKVSDLARHMITHSDQKKYTCAVCKKQYRHKISYEYHVSSHVGNGLQTCPICKEQVRALKKHMFMHKERPKLPCPKCSKSFISKPSLKQHMVTHLERYKKICPVCKVECCDLKRHQQVHLPMSDRPKLNCPKCLKVFHSKPYLKKHMVIHLEQYKKICPVCKVETTDLKTHQRVHLPMSVKKTFACPECDKLFTLKGNLKQHRLRHH